MSGFISLLAIPALDDSRLPSTQYGRTPLCPWPTPGGQEGCHRSLPCSSPRSSTHTGSGLPASIGR